MHYKEKDEDQRWRRFPKYVACLFALRLRGQCDLGLAFCFSLFLADGAVGFWVLLGIFRVGDRGCFSLGLLFFFGLFCVSFRMGCRQNPLNMNI
jgi:hypothetical protein